MIIFRTRSGDVVPASIRCRGDVATVTGKKFAMRAYSGGPLTLDGFPLPVVVDLAGMTFDQQVPTPFDHNLDNIVGQTTRVQITAAGLMVEGQLSGDTPSSKALIATSKSTKWEASIGAPVTEMEEYGAGETVRVNNRTFTGPILVARKTRLQEISFVRRGADVGQTFAAIAARKADMTYEAWLVAHGIVDASTIPSGLVATLRAAYAAEYPEDRDMEAVEEMRAQGIKAIAGKHPAIAARATAEGWDLGRTQSEVELHVIRAGRASGGWIATGDGNPSLAAPEDAISAAIVIRAAGHSVAERIYKGQAAILEASRPLQSSSMYDMARYLLQARGQQVPSDRYSVIRAATSGTNTGLAVALGNSATKLVFDAYQFAPETWRSFCQVRDVPNFKQHTGIRPAMVGELVELPRGGSIEHGVLDEATFTFQIGSFARKYTIDRQDIIDDDLGIFAEIAPSIGRAGARAVGDCAIAVLIGNAGSFFASGNTNLQTGGGSVLQSSSLTTAIKNLRLQRDAEGNTLGLTPTTLLVPPSLEMTARALLASAELWRSADAAPTGNPLQAAAQLQVEARLENGVTFRGTLQSGSATAWYLFANPVNAAQILAFLDGKDAPTVESFGFDANPDKLEMSWRVFHDFGSALGDYRAAQKSAGA
jgi:hypothetical protein